MPIQGLRDTSNFVTDQRPKNWREGILLLYPNGKMPLTALTSLMKSRSVDDPEFNWWEKELDDRRLVLGANLTAANTTITVTAGAQGLKQGDLLYVEESEEILFVASDPASDTSITVTRGFAGTTPATLDYDGAAVNPNLLVIGSAYEEGSLAPTGVNFDPTKKYNYTQIFRNTLEATRTATKTRLRTGDAIKEAKRECLEYHGIDMERAFWLGQRYEGTRNGKPHRATGGVLSWLPNDNIKNANAGVDMETLEEYLYEIFLYGSSEKMAFCGNRSLLTIQQVVRKNSSIEIMSGLKEFGMNVSRLICPFGELVLKTHPLFNQVRGGTNGASPYYGMEAWMAVLDMDNVGYTYLKDSDTKYQPDLAANGMDGMKSGYLTEAAIELHHAKTHYLVKNFHTAAADS